MSSPVHSIYRPTAFGPSVYVFVLFVEETFSPTGHQNAKNNLSRRFGFGPLWSIFNIIRVLINNNIENQKWKTAHPFLYPGVLQ